MQWFMMVSQERRPDPVKGDGGDGANSRGPGRPDREEKPVRVRAGFQVYQPKRLGRLSEEPAAEQPSTSAPHS
jgi:hypothetical protein